MVKKEGFWNGSAVSLIGLGLMFGVGTSFIPGGSWISLTTNMTITFVCMILAKHWWNNVSEQSHYDARVVFLMLVSVGFFSATPLLRISYNTILFIPVILLYLFILFTSLYYKQLFLKLYSPKLSKLFRVVNVLLFSLVVISLFFVSDGQEILFLSLLDQYREALIISIILYGIGLLFSYLSTTMLKKLAIKSPGNGKGKQIRRVHFNK